MRTCMFCQEQASSKEDIWPQWLTKQFPLSDTSCMEAERGGQKLGTWKNKSPKLLPARCVCGSCNSGWMSKLEVEMKPIVESILDKQLRVLDASSQAVISVWAIKTAMALAHDANRYRVRPTGYGRRHLRWSRRPLDVALLSRHRFSD